MWKVSWLHIYINRGFLTKYSFNEISATWMENARYLSLCSRKACKWIQLQMTFSLHKMYPTCLLYIKYINLVCWLKSLKLNLEPSEMVWIVPPQIYIHPKSVNGRTLFENRVSAEIINLRWGFTGLGWALNLSPIWLVSFKKRETQTER